MPQTDFSRFSLGLETETFLYRAPIKFGGRVVTDATVLNVVCQAQTGAGRAVGLGSMTMGVAWAWPHPTVTDVQKLAHVLALAERFADSLQSVSQVGHPLQLCHHFATERDKIAAAYATQNSLSEPIPPLAILLAASPIEAALFDAHGKAASKSSYQLLGREHLTQDLSYYLDDSYRGLYLDQFVLPQPVASLPLYHLVGALDCLRESELTQSLDDSLPESLDQWIRRDSLTHLKIKLAGDDLRWDLQRVLDVSNVADENSISPGQPWSFSLDFNERCDSEEYVLELLCKLSEQSPAALQRIAYIEQPTHRDLERFPENTMHRVTQRLPVVIDESLVGLASLRTAIGQGYSGIALKACKGHAEALLMGAVAVREGLYLCVQDLTCVGASLLHSASLASHIPTVAAVESNGRQYCPAGNAAWLGSRFEPFFEVRNGRLPTALLDGPGLGY